MYSVAIIAGAIVLAIIGVVWLLRDKITSGHFSGSAKEQSVKAEFKAAAPQKPSNNPPTTSPPVSPGSSPSVDISGNTIIGMNVIRVLRDKTRVSFNWLLGKNRIEVKADNPPVTARDRERKNKRVKK
jgi:hypothetical protein